MKTTAQIKALMYHRVDAIDTDPWGICVTPQTFENQIQYITRHYLVISVAEAVLQLATGNIQEHSICITFDDGYADNYTYAKPILEKYNCPATFFIPTAFIGATEPFWWDELEYIFLHLPQLPTELLLTVNGADFHYKINEATLTNNQQQQHQKWKWYDAPLTDRCATFLSVWESLRPLPQPVIQQYILELRKWAGINTSTHFRLPMDGHQLQTLFSNPLFTAGLHTHTHPDLKTKSKEIQVEEIERGRNVLQTQYNLHCQYLAYPYGNYNKATLQAAKELNLTACFTTEAAAIEVGGNIHTLGRYQAGNWNVAELNKNVSI